MTLQFVNTIILCTRKVHALKLDTAFSKYKNLCVEIYSLTPQGETVEVEDRFFAANEFSDFRRRLGVSEARTLLGAVGFVTENNHVPYAVSIKGIGTKKGQVESIIRDVMDVSPDAPGSVHCIEEITGVDKVDAHLKKQRLERVVRGSVGYVLKRLSDRMPLWVELNKHAVNPELALNSKQLN